ncbi:hypothetical protein C6V04_29745 [Burkholderia multivorans]|nr:hypothetical protein C6V04_29745 [Burkholderia multivorans]
MSPHADAPGIRVCTGLTGVFRGPPGLHSPERFARASSSRSIDRNFSEIPLVQQNSKLTVRNMAG